MSGYRIGLSLTTTRNDRNGLAREVDKLNAKFKHLAKEHKIRTIDHDENIDETCLSFKKLRLNKKGNSAAYREYKNFNEENFLTDLNVNLNWCHPNEYQTFEDTFVQTFDKHAPKKQKVLRANKKPYMNKDLNKAIKTIDNSLRQLDSG